MYLLYTVQWEENDVREEQTLWYQYIWNAYTCISTYPTHPVYISYIHPVHLWNTNILYTYYKSMPPAKWDIIAFICHTLLDERKLWLNHWLTFSYNLKLMVFTKLIELELLISKIWMTCFGVFNSIQRTNDTPKQTLAPTPECMNARTRQRQMHNISILSHFTHLDFVTLLC